MTRMSLNSHGTKTRTEQWSLLIWCHLSQILAGGLLKSLAVFLDDILAEFDSSVALLGWMFSLEAFFFGVTCPFVSFATKRLGPRSVMMIGGVVNGGGILMASLATNIFIVGAGISMIAGIGCSMIYASALVTVRRNFREHYAIANGVTLAGVSVAVFLFPPIIRLLIDHFGWRGALTILSGISLNATVTGSLIRDHHGELKRRASTMSTTPMLNGRKTSCIKMQPPRQLMSSGHVLARGTTISMEKVTHGLLGLVVFLWSASNTAVLKYLVTSGVQRGLTSIQGAVLLSVTGVAQCVCLLTNGIIISRGWLNILHLYFLVLLLMAGAEFGLAYYQHYAVGLAMVAIFGLGTGTASSLNLVVQRTLDHRAGVQAAGWLMFTEGLAGCIGGVGVGALRDLSGSYTLPFITTGVMTSIAAVVVVVIIAIRRLNVRGQMYGEDL